MTVFFAHSGIHIQTLTQTPQTWCSLYLMKLLSYIDSWIANNPNVCKSLANILLKSFLTSNSDKEQMVRCLRQKQNLSVTMWAGRWVGRFVYLSTVLCSFNQFYLVYACTVLYLFYLFYSVLCFVLFETDCSDHSKNWNILRIHMFHWWLGL